MKSKVRINILNEKRIRGFSGSNYDDEAIDALKEFAEAGKVLSQQIKEKTFSEDDPLVQEIFSLLDEDTQGELRELTQQLMDLVSELPDKPEKQKIGFRETLEEKEKPGLWANIRAKRKRVGKAGMAKKGSKAYKSAKKAGDEINKEKNEELKNPKKADLDKDGKLSSYEKARGKGIEKAMGLEEESKISLKKIRDIIKKTLEKEGGASGLKPLKKATDMSTKDLEQTLDKMGNVKKHKHDDYILTPIEEDIYEGGCMEEDMYEGGCMEEEYDNTDTLEEVYIVESEDEIQMIEDALNEEEEEVEEGRKKGKCKPSKGKRFAKRVNGKCRSFGQKGKASDGGDRIRPGTKKAHAYCARSAKIKKCKNPPCANTLSRRKWKCQGSRSVPE